MAESTKESFILTITYCFSARISCAMFRPPLFSYLTFPYKAMPDSPAPIVEIDTREYFESASGKLCRVERSRDAGVPLSLYTSSPPQDLERINRQGKSSSQ